MMTVGEAKWLLDAPCICCAVDEGSTRKCAECKIREIRDFLKDKPSEEIIDKELEDEINKM